MKIEDNLNVQVMHLHMTIPSTLEKFKWHFINMINELEKLSNQQPSLILKL